MRTITITALTIQNFKGSGNFTILPNLPVASFYGDNGTGKTTLIDAYFWAITGKDSLEQTDFEIKPKGSHGKHVVTSVEVTLEDQSGETLTIRRDYREKWSTVKGSAKPTFSGHTTDLYVNTVPVSASEFNTRVQQWLGITLPVFRLLSDPIHAAGRLAWTSLRGGLLKLRGELSLQEVLESNPHLHEVRTLLEKNTIEDVQKINQATLSRAKNAIEDIGARIDEQYRVAQQAPAAEVDIAPLQAQLDTLLEQRSADKASSALGQLQSERTAAMQALSAKRAEIDNAISKRLSDAQAAQRNAQSALHSADSQKDLTLKQIAKYQQDLTKLNDEISALQQQEQDELAKSFEYTAEKICPACSQPLPEEQITAAIASAESNFNERKAMAIRAIREEIDAKQSTITGTLNIKEAHQSKLDQLDQAIIAAKARLEACNAAIKTLSAEQIDWNEYPELMQAESAVKRAEEAIAAYDPATAELDSSLEDNIQQKRAQIKQAEQANAEHKQRLNSERRILELRSEEENHAATIERIGKENYLIQEFIKAQCSMLEHSINSYFKITKFELFKIQINEGVAQICIPTVDGVPYQSLNTASRINAGIDICATFQSHYQVRLPIFIDHCESNTNPLETESQQLRFIVEPGAKEIYSR